MIHIIVIQALTLSLNDSEKSSSTNAKYFDAGFVQRAYLNFEERLVSEKVVEQARTFTMVQRQCGSSINGLLLMAHTLVCYDERFLFICHDLFVAERGEKREEPEVT